MNKRTLPRALAGAGWTHPYPIHPFSPLLYADGGSEGGDASGSDSGDGPAGDSGTSDGAQAGDGDGKAKKDSGDDPAATIRRLEQQLADARKDAAKARTTAKQKAADDAVAALTERLGKALGFVKEDGPPDPEKLAKAVAEKDTAIADRDAALRTKDVELSVWARADKLKARAGALLDSRSFLASIKDLDPSSKGFTTALDDAIKAAVKDNPAYGATPPAGRSGGDHTGSSGEAGARKRSSSLADAIRSEYGT